MPQREVIAGETPLKKQFRLWILPFLIGAFCFILILLLARTGVMKLLELRLYDLRMQARRSLNSTRLNPDIAIVELDAESYRQIREPLIMWLPRFTEILNHLAEGGAKTVGLDIHVSKSLDEFVTEGLGAVLDRTDMAEKEKEATRHRLGMYYPRFDNEFGAALRCSHAFAVCWIEEASGVYTLPGKDVTLFAGEGNLATANIYPDDDNVVRRVASHWTDRRGRTLFTLSFATAARYLGKEKELQDGSFVNDLKLDRNGNLLINYVGPAGTFPHFSFYKVYEEARKGNSRFFTEHFKNKIVLIGASDLASHDLKYTPFNDRQEIFPGVEIHANAIHTILQRDFIRRAPPALFQAVLFLLVIIFFFIGFRLTPAHSVLAALMLSLVYVAAAFGVFIWGNLWISIATPLLGLLIVFMASYIYRFITVEQEKKWVQKVLGRYVSQSVADALLAHPEMIDFHGEEREISVLFSDINHFTSISESRTPREIMEALNDYFTLMEEVVFRHRGTLKQFVGDEIMVIFGAPEEQPDHRRRAVLTALEWEEEIEKWRERREREGLFHFDAKMGIHCGRVTVGNVGSPHRTEYAAVGDTVNTGSRIMGLNKKFDTTICISEEVYNDVRDLVEVKDQGVHSVKGKGVELHIYSVEGRKKAGKKKQ